MRKTFYQLGVVVALVGAVVSVLAGRVDGAACLTGLAIIFKLDAQASA